jgi:hypothetical protein
MERIWAEVGIWNAGEPALVVMRGFFDENGQPFDNSPEVLHDVPLAFPDSFDEKRSDVADLPWGTALNDLGYRAVPGQEFGYSAHAVVFDVETVG